MNDGEIGLFKLAHAYLPAELRGGRGRLRKNHQAGYDLVEPVHRADIRIISAQRLAQKRGHTARIVSRYDPGGLDGDYYVVIIINNIHGYTLSQLLKFVKI